MGTTTTTRWKTTTMIMKRSTAIRDPLHPLVSLSVRKNLPMLTCFPCFVLSYFDLKSMEKPHEFRPRLPLSCSMATSLTLHRPCYQLTSFIPPPDNSPSGDTGESIPTFEFPCPHDDEAFAVASPSLSPPPPSSSLSAGDADDSGVILSPVSLHSSPSALSRDNSLPACTPSAIVSTALTTTSPTATTTTTSSSSSALPASSPSSSASPGISSRPETYVRRRAARNSVNGDAAGNSSALSPPDASGKTEPKQ